MASLLQPIDALVIWWTTLQIGCVAIGLVVLLTLKRPQAPAESNAAEKDERSNRRDSRGRYTRARIRRAARRRRHPTSAHAAR